MDALPRCYKARHIIRLMIQSLSYPAMSAPKAARVYVLAIIISIVVSGVLVLLVYSDLTPPQTMPDDELNANGDDVSLPPPSSANYTIRIPSAPEVNDPDLEVQLIYKGLAFPTQMAFLAEKDILVLQKNDGKVQRITDCTLQPEPVLDLPVANLVERGLLGIAVSDEQEDGKKYAFIFFTLAEETDGDDAKGSPPLGHKLYRYDVVNGTLINPLPLFSVPAARGGSHNGGFVTIGPDSNVYFSIGDIASSTTRSQNLENGTAADGTSTIARMTFEGKSPGAILGPDQPISYLYAYGIRNSYGLDFDPLTGKLWETENGPNYGDEINLVEPAFNGGWRQVMGFPDYSRFDPDADLVECLYCDRLTGFIDRWVYSTFFGVKNGRYSDPEFVWQTPVGVTGIKFLGSDKLGVEYEGDIFVADYVLGVIYHFQLNAERSAIVLEGLLSDKVANDWSELEPVIFAPGFRAITDLEVGKDGFLYVLSYLPDEGAIYRIVPKGTPLPC